MTLPQASIDEVADSSESKRDKERHREELAAVILLMIGLYGAQVYSEIGVEKPPGDMPSEIGWASRRARDILDQVNGTTRRQVAAALTESVGAGESTDQAIARIGAVFDNADRVRAPLIGDTTATEVGGFVAYNIATHTGVQRLVWSTMADMLVRDSHEVMDGQAKHPGEFFVSGLGNTAYYPGNFGVAADDINCRCWLEIELSGKSAAARRPELSHIRESIRQLAAQHIAGVMRGIFRDQRSSVIATARRLGA